MNKEVCNHNIEVIEAGEAKDFLLSGLGKDVIALKRGRYLLGSGVEVQITEQGLIATYCSDNWKQEDREANKRETGEDNKALLFYVGGYGDSQELTIGSAERLAETEYTKWLQVVHGGLTSKVIRAYANIAVTGASILTKNMVIMAQVREWWCE
ncbi:hypothetical protein [Bacillus cereus]|uniref:hypothetical protein n=1 Tax=Bacillus cereus TaxID=1396 RepID=UPI000BFB6BDC|nr:hypothetical protein [Bacillus cereus]PGR83716.1 hypothetical protein COC63_06930 [Bacillus cereus]